MPPRIFVPGPSVNPNLIGSPSSFLSNIGNIANSRRQARIAEERTETDKLFKQGQADRAQQQLDFTLAAPERAEELRVANLEREADKFQTVQDHAKGAQFVGGDRFTGFEDELAKDPRYNQLDAAGKLAARNEFILKNPTALTPPKQFRETLEAGLAATGKFTGDEIQAYVAAEMAERYPTADKDLVKAQILSPKDLLASGNQNITIGSDGKIFSTGRGGRGGAKLINDPSSQAQRDEVVDSIAGGFAVAEKTGHLPWFLGGARLEIPGGGLNMSKQDIEGIVGIMATEGGIVSPTAMQNVLVPGIALTSKGELKEDYDYRTEPGKQKLIAAAKKSQATEERLLTKGGDISAAGQATGGAIFSPVDAANAAAQYNETLLSGLTPQALSDADVVTSFLNTLGAAQPAVPPVDNTRQGGNQGGSDVVTPEVAPPAAVVDPQQAAIAAAAQAEDDAIFSHITNQATPTPQTATNAPLIGGQVPAERILQEALTPENLLGNINPLVRGTIAGVKEVAPQVKKLFESLTPPAGRGILSSAPEQTPRQATQAAVESLSGPERTQALSAARQLASQGVISIADADGQGNSREEALLIAYLKHIEGQR
jgi:hypothetical protein